MSIAVHGELAMCSSCGKACCQCEKCAKIKGHSGLCSTCWTARAIAVEKAKAEQAAKPSEAKP